MPGTTLLVLVILFTSSSLMPGCLFLELPFVRRSVGTGVSMQLEGVLESPVPVVLYAFKLQASGFKL